MITAEQVLLEYNILADAGASSKQIYEGMCDEIAMLRNALTEKQQPTAVVLETLPEQKYKKVVYVKVKGKHGYEVHNYANTVEEDNATIINNVKKQLKDDKVDVVSVFVAEK